VKIVHLSTSLNGGAAVTAKTIVQMQTNNGHNAMIMYRKSDLNIAKKAFSASSTLLSVANSTREYDQVTHFSASGISTKQISSEKPEIIFIHNWFNLLSLSNLKTISKLAPLIFVAHDFRLASGGCHIALDCTNFMSGCKHCPAAKIDWFSSKAKKSIDSVSRGLGNYAVVTPSEWLMDKMSGTEILQNASLKRVIPNPTNAQSGVERTNSRNINFFFKILFVAATLESRFKGLPILLEALSKIKATKPEIEIQLNIVGTGQIPKHWLPIFGIQTHLFGLLESADVHKLMRESDLLVVPSLSENFPGVVGEAQILGCVVAASNVGGIPEMIEDGLTGFMFEPNPQDCLKTILRAINSPDIDRIRDLAKQRAMVRHDPIRINDEYEKVIEGLI